MLTHTLSTLALSTQSCCHCWTETGASAHSLKQLHSIRVGSGWTNPTAVKLLGQNRKTLLPHNLLAHWKRYEVKSRKCLRISNQTSAKRLNFEKSHGRCSCFCSIKLRELWHMCGEVILAPNLTCSKCYMVLLMY